MFLDGFTVPVAEVAAQVGSSPVEVEQEAVRLNVFIGEDWAGRPSVSAADAHGLVSGAARRDLDFRSAWQAFIAEKETWQSQREQVRRAAYQAAYEDGVRAGRGNSVSADLGHGSAREAVARFEVEHPEPMWREPRSRVRLFGRRKERVR